MMDDLSPKQILFVHEYIKSGNGKLSAIKAGYSEKTAESQASRLLRNAKVQQFLNKQKTNLNIDLREMFAESAVKAYQVLHEIMLSSDASHRDRLSAAKDLLDRAGYKPIDKVMADVNSEGTLEVIIQTPDVDEGGWNADR